PGQDLRFHWEKVESTWNFANKVWNASRFALMNLEDFKHEDIHLSGDKSIADKWILTRLNETIAQVTAHSERYDFGEAGRYLYNLSGMISVIGISKWRNFHYMVRMTRKSKRKNQFWHMFSIKRCDCFIRLCHLLRKKFGNRYHMRVILYRLQLGLKFNPNFKMKLLQGK